MKTTHQTADFAVRVATHPELLIEVIGELDLASVPIFQAAVRDLGLSSRRRVVLDLRRLGFIDAAGLHAVLDLHAASLNASAVLTILPGPRIVQRVFELAGVAQLMPFSSSSSLPATLCPDAGASDGGNVTNSIPRVRGGTRDNRGEESE